MIEKESKTGLCCEVIYLNIYSSDSQLARLQRKMVIGHGQLGAMVFRGTPGSSLATQWKMPGWSLAFPGYGKFPVAVIVVVNASFFITTCMSSENVSRISAIGRHGW